MLIHKQINCMYIYTKIHKYRLAGSTCLVIDFIYIYIYIADMFFLHQLYNIIICVLK